MSRPFNPGLDPRRLASLVRAAVERCDLDLGGKVVLTEAATGAYVVTPILAACGGADRVYAMTRSTAYGSVDEVIAETLEVAGLAGVADRIEFVTRRSRDIVERADIVTNSGHVRPIDAEFVGWMKRSAVVSLMYEAWEFRPGDVDLDACRARGIPVAATDERHADVDVFSFLGTMAIKLLMDAHVAVYRSSILLLCDNQFCGFIARTLRKTGASVDVADRIDDAPREGQYDAIVVALRPKAQFVLAGEAARVIAERWPGSVVAQYWGDIDRASFQAAGIPLWPARPPAAGHMGVLPSAIGPEPVIRLQAGGLKVGELLSRGVRGGLHDCLQPMISAEVIHA
jgi:hypothetical protein